MFSTSSSYKDNPCGDPTHEVHHLSYNSAKPTVFETYEGYHPSTTYYLGITGKRTYPDGTSSVERLSQTSTKTLDSSFINRVWHSEVTTTSTKVNWTTSQGTVLGYLICWKKAGQAIGICSQANENRRVIASSQQEGSFIIHGLIPGECYKVKVKVESSGEERNKIGTDKFTTTPAPRIDVWSQDITASSINMRWTANTVYSKYEVCWKKVGSLKDTCHAPQTVYSPTTSYPITGLKSKTSYKNRVFSITSSGTRASLFDDPRKTSR